jgi:hypothetical protein
MNGTHKRETIKKEKTKTFSEALERIKDSLDPECREFAIMQFDDVEKSLTSIAQGRVNSLLTFAYHLAMDMPEEGRIRLGLQLLKDSPKEKVVAVMMSDMAVHATGEVFPEEEKNEADESVNEKASREIMEQIKKEEKK